MPASIDAEKALAKMNPKKSFPLTDRQKREIQNSGFIYIYNVSPIHEWPVSHQQLGTLTIRRRDWDAIVSEPLTLPGVVARQFDKGFGRYEWMLDDGMEVAEDICKCSKKYPLPDDSNADLTKYGVFILDKPFEKLSDRERGRVIEEATEKFLEKCRQLILLADQYHSQQNGKYIAEIHRQALKALNHLTDGKDERPWAPITISEKRQDCPFCGHKNKTGIAKCANCHEIIDQQLYDKLKKGKTA